ncbi:MAG TPA: SMC family ATPase [Gemmatimonadales bacterium]
MQLTRLRLVNFRQHELTDLQLDRGLIGIVGANGAGKTTLLEAIAYALYGVPGTRGTRETLRRRNAPPRARFEVHLEFSLGGHLYAITRTLTGAELSQDGQIIANSTGAVTERVVATLAMTRDEFFNTYFTGQKDLAVMAAMGRTERAQFLSRVIGYDRLRKAQDVMRQERTSLRSQRTGLEQGMVDPATLEAELTQAQAALEEARTTRAAAYTLEADVRERLATLTPAWTVAQERRVAWQMLDGERRMADKRVAVVREQFRTLDQQLAHALQARARLIELAPVMAEWTALAAEREALDRAAVAYNERSRTLARRDEAVRRRGELGPQLEVLPDQAQLAALGAARAALVTSREALDTQVNERRTRWTEDNQEARTKLDAFRDRYRELKEQRDLIEQQGPDGICPTCGQPLGQSVVGMLALLSRQLEEVQTDGTYYNQRVAQLADPPPDLRDLDTARQDLERELRRATEALGQAQAQARQREMLVQESSRLDREIGELAAVLDGTAADYDAPRHAVVRDRLAELDPSRREHDQLAGVAQRAELLGGQVTAAEQQASAADAELLALDQRLAALNWNAEEFDATERSVREAEHALQGAQFTVQSAGETLAHAERDRTAALARQADLATRAEKARALTGEIDLLDELDRAYSDLRTELNLQLRPDLSDRASALLRDLTGGRYADLELDEGYLPTVIEDGEAKAVISGGEEDVVNLALRLAISQLIAERAGQPLSLLVLDEIFGSLDEERRTSVLALLRSLSDRFPQVILITHVEGMGDAFDRLIRMSYDVETGVTSVRDDTAEVLDVAV